MPSFSEGSSVALVALKLAPQECRSSRVRGNRALATRSDRAGEVPCMSLSLRVFATPSSTKKIMRFEKGCLDNDNDNAHGQRSTVNGQRSTVNGQRSTVNGQRSTVNGQRSHWSLVTGHWSLVTGHWSLVTGHWSLVTGHWSLSLSLSLSLSFHCTAL